MNEQKDREQSLKAARKMIFDMINASWELAEKLGDHPLKDDCSCISCVNKRKRIVAKEEKEWKFKL